MSICNISSDKAEPFFFEATSEYMGEDCVGDYDEMKAKFLKGEDLEIAEWEWGEVP